MAKLKKAKVTIHVCPTCKGNGYLKVATEGKDTAHQCWDCDSEGEYYETTDMGWIDSIHPPSHSPNIGEQYLFPLLGL